MAKVHWFFSYGTAKAEPNYRHPAESSRTVKATHVTPALLALGWPIPPDAQADVVFTCFVTDDLFKEQVPSGGKPGDPWVPAQLFVETCAKLELGEAVTAAARRHDAANTVPGTDVASAWKVVADLLAVPEDCKHVVVEASGGLMPLRSGLALGAGLLRATRPGLRVTLTYAEFGGQVNDLSELLDLFDWAHAARVGSDQLDWAPLARLLRGGKLARELENLGDAMGLGWSRHGAAAMARAWDEPLPALVPGGAGGQVAATGHVLEHFLAASADLAECAPADDENLSLGRLRYEVLLAEQWLRAGRSAEAARQLRETLVNAMLLATGDATPWLDHPARAKAERALGRLERRADGNDTQKAVASAWRSAREIRNVAAHGGYSRAAKSVAGHRQATREAIKRVSNALGLPGCTDEELQGRLDQLQAPSPRQVVVVGGAPEALLGTVGAHFDVVPPAAIALPARSTMVGASQSGRTEWVVRYVPPATTDAVLLAHDVVHGSAVRRALADAGIACWALTELDGRVVIEPYP